MLGDTVMRCKKRSKIVKTNGGRSFSLVIPSSTPLSFAAEQTRFLSVV